ncbi:MAG: restriction endonuclease subunit S [Alphaproteobacteria bacterium]|nr:restriction endonuclease subunit S [Alphaproteobacteria bacterium]
MRVGSVDVGDVWSEGARLTGAYHLSEDQVAVSRLGRLKKRCVPLAQVVSGRGVFRGPIFRRVYASGPSHGEPYVSASDLLEAHVRPASYLSPSLGPLLDELRLQEGMILVTCSGMNLGSAMWTRSDMAGLVGTHDLIRIIPNGDSIPPGYLYAFLVGRYGHAWIRKQIYGGNIKHIEPSHLEPMPIPRLGSVLEEGAHELMMKAAALMAQFNTGVTQATLDFFESVGLADITFEQWHDQGRDTDFTTTFPQSTSIRALNYNPRFLRLSESLQRTEWRPLGELVRPGTLARGKRFARVDAEGEHAVKLIGQKHLFWMRPLGRDIARWALPPDAFPEPGTILVAAQGTLGETELYCRGDFVWSDGTKHAYSEHLLRVIADESKFRSGCLFAFLRSETAFRLLRSMSAGSKQQEQHKVLREQLPVPIPGDEDQNCIHALVVESYEARHQAVRLEDEAIRLVESAVEDAS